ncbi:MAG: hypothetical protein WCS37_05375 [Chloroflexota bacterium]|nr:hypothetical protein [Chloroflexota bacterium]
MSDPHIDIEDVENPTPQKDTAKADNTRGADFDDTTKVGWGSDSYKGLPNIFRRWWEKSGSGDNRKAFEEVFTPEARQHFRASQREFLLGWRNIIDRSLERLAQQDVPNSHPSSEKTTSKAEKIVVEEIDL